MFAYCRNNPVSRKDISGTADVTCAGIDGELLSDDDINEIHKNGGAGLHSSGASSPIGYSYSVPSGGGGTTSSVRVGSTTVSFGHGGRHMLFDDISGLESAIAHDVVSRPPTIGKFGEVPITYGGVEFTYRYFSLSEHHINVGTYFYTVTK